MYRRSNWSADGRFHNDSLFLPLPSFVNSPLHYFYFSTLFFKFCLYIPPCTFPLLCFLLLLFVPLYLFSTFLPFTLYFLPSHVFHVTASASASPSYISLFPRCSLINSVYCAVLLLFFLTLFLLFRSPPDGDALALR